MSDLQPHWQNDRVTLYCGDALETLKQLPAESVHCCVTSPPYYGLRDYGVEGQIGLEQTPDEYIAKMVEVFREVRRVLRSDGTCWINIGDSYFSQTKGSGGSNPETSPKNAIKGVDNFQRFDPVRIESGSTGCKPKDLIGIPWMLAFALRSDGWWLRQDIVWSKPNPMPESVRDRCTKSHEYIFLLSKSPRYYFDNEAIKEPIKDISLARLGRGVSPENKLVNGATGQSPHAIHQPRANVKFGGSNLCPDTRLQSGNEWQPRGSGANKRSVWPVTTKPFKGAHFAVFPPDLIEPCIKASCPLPGKQCDCDEVIATPTGKGPIHDPSILTGRAGMNRPRRDDEGSRAITRREQRGEAEQMRRSAHRRLMEEACGSAFEHYIRTDVSGARPLPESLRQTFLSCGWLQPVEPCECPDDLPGIVLDPFAGSGTTGMVASALGRNSILIELNPQYCELIKERVTTGWQKAKPKPMSVKKKPAQPESQSSLFDVLAS